MIIRDKQSVEQGITARLVQDCIREFTGRVLPRLVRLKNYYDGEHDIVHRVRTRGLPNNRLVHGFPRYISTMNAGYLLGNPAEYAAEGQETALQTLRDCYEASSVDSVDAELAIQASVYGRSVEVLYMDETPRPWTATLDPRNAFVVYDDTVRHLPLFGLHWWHVPDEQGLTRHVVCDVYTERERIRLQGTTVDAVQPTGEQEPHYFGAVPVIEYWNNADETGDFEPVLSLIDAYDLLQSDRANDKQQFADALLVLTGVMLDAEDPDDPRSPGERLREDKAISLPDRDAKAEWLTKQLNEADTQVLADSIEAAIHKLAFTPDITDENFASNSSGVAMKFKLLGLEQQIRIKERWFREGLQARLRLFANVLAAQGKPRLDADAVQISFARSLPGNDLEMAQTVQTLQGIVPDQLLLAQLPFVQDAKAALQMLAEQREEGARQQAALFGQYADANQGREPEQPRKE